MLEALLLKPVVVACLAALGTFAIIVGCDAPSTDGTNVRGGSSGADDDDDTAKKKSSSSSGEVQADCAKLPAADKNAACDQCTRSKCCTPYANCQASDACKTQAACIGACADGDLFCLLGCQGQSDEATTLGTALGNCLQANCSSECASSSPNLDAGLDPFGDF